MTGLVWVRLDAMTGLVWVRLDAMTGLSRRAGRA